MTQHSNDLMFDIVYGKYQEDVARGEKAHNMPVASNPVEQIREKVASYLVALAVRLVPAEAVESRHESIQAGTV